MSENAEQSCEVTSATGGVEDECVQASDASSKQNEEDLSSKPLADDHVSSNFSADVQRRDEESIGDELVPDTEATSSTASTAEPVWENGRYVFTDPVTKVKQYWEESSSQWKPVDATNSSSEGPDGENPPSQELPPGTEFRDGLYRYKDESGKELYWDVASNSWKSFDYECFTDEDTGKQCYRDPTDGSVFEWDAAKQAWFPKIDEDFLAVYQMQYGVTENTNEAGHEKKDAGESEKKVEEKEGEKPGENGDTQSSDKSKKRKPDPPSWFEIEEEKNTNVYVQGLPLDITEEEFVQVMSKCGLVAKDPDSGKWKIKLYRNAEGKLKGDGLCCYIRRESVDLALQILDGYNLRNFNLKVQQAQFTLKGTYDPSKKPRKKKKQEKEKIKKMQEKLLAWKPDELRGQRPRSDKVVVIKNLFDPAIFKKDPKLILDLQNELINECVKFGGAKKVVIHDRHEDGVAEIFFKEFEQSDLCVQIMNKRLFGDRRLVAELWDGKTKYRIEETEEERKERLGQWEKFLEADA